MAPLSLAEGNAPSLLRAQGDFEVLVRGAVSLTLAAAQSAGWKQSSWPSWDPGSATC